MATLLSCFEGTLTVQDERIGKKGNGGRREEGKKQKGINPNSFSPFPPFPFFPISFFPSPFLSQEPLDGGCFLVFFLSGEQGQAIDLIGRLVGRGNDRRRVGSFAR